MMLTIDLIRAFTGLYRLPVYECDKTKVQTPRRRVRPLRQSSTDIRFSAWRLAHALKKADCARSPSPKILRTGAAGFLFEHVHLFDCNSRELRLNVGMSNFYADFTRTSLSGRIAQGMALLFLEERGYAYVGRFAAEMQSYGGGQKLLNSQKIKPKRSPDFIVENSSNERALAEAKGSFVSVGGTPNIKGELNEALKQLDGWDKLLNPQPSKSFAVGTFLRESKDFSKEPSLIAFVDPDPEQPQDPIELPPDAIRRANYASWLTLMGRDDASRRLRAREGEPQRGTVPVITLGGHQYLITIASIRPRYMRDVPDPKNRQLNWDWLYRHFGSFPDGISIELIGLDLSVLRALGATLRDHRPEKLMAIEPSDRRDIPSEFDGGEFSGSVFSDGSLLGEIRIQGASRSSIEWIEVEL